MESTPRIARATAKATEILTLSRPQNGAVSTFDSQDYAVIDFILIDHQWAALVQLGRTLQIVFSNGAIIELLNFFSSDSAYDGSSDEDHTGAVLGKPVEPLLLTSAGQTLSSEEFVQTYWITKGSGSFLVSLPSEDHTGDLGAEMELHPTDTPPFPILPDLSEPFFPLFGPLPPPPPQPPLPTPPLQSIPGTNHPAVITGPITGTVIEAGGVNNGTPGTPTAAGDLHASDVDNPNDAWAAVGAATASASGYGTYTLTATGVWTYTLDNANATVQALNVGGTLTDTFTVSTVDGTKQVVTITIKGANDAPVAVADSNASDAVVESGVGPGNTPFAGDPLATGNVLTNDTDVDSGDSKTVTAVNGSALNIGQPLVGTYGTLTLLANGNWSYVLNNADPDTNALAQGQTATDVFTYTIADANGATSSTSLTITITGTNDAAVISGTTAGAVTEAGGVNNGIPGTPTATGDLTSTDVDNPNDAWTAVSAPTASANGFGSYTLTADGLWTYTLSNSNPAVQALNVGDVLIDSFTVTTVDGTAQLVTITIDGANDAAVISGTAAGAVTEAGGVNNDTPGTPIATGDLTSTDVDNPPDVWDAVTTSLRGASGYGSYTLTAGGAWTYTLDNSNATVQALNVGQTLTDTFTVTTVDGTSQLVTVTIDGANDAAVISGTTAGAVTEAGGVNNGIPGTPTATGDLTSTDVDNPTDAWTAVSVPTASANGFGSYTLTAVGVWTYTLSNNNASVQALNVGDTLIDSFTVTTVDGTAQLVTITIDGANDAAVITGDTTGNVIEAGRVGSGIPGIPVATGNLDATDVDNPSDAWTVVGTATPGANGYGSYTLTAAGVWTYSLDNSNAAVQALNAGQTLTDTFTAFTVDGTAQLVTVTIHGANDAAVISGTTAGAVTEAGGVANGTPGTPIATGDLTSTDVDNPPDDWTAVSAPTASANGFGSYTLTAAGVWTYTLNNSNAAVQALNVGDILIDSFTVTTVDGTQQLVTINITGANDAAVISGPATGTVVEAGGVNNDAPGTPTATGDLTAADVDNPADAWTAVSAPTASANGFGTYTLTADGLWTYTLSNSNPAVQALNTGDTLTDTFAATTVDGTAQLVTVTIHGANDAAVISGATTGSVTEAGGVGSGIPGIPVATGNLNATDVDNPPDDWAPVATAAPGANGYGSYTLTAAGVWTYSLDNSNPAVQALNTGDTLTDTFAATTVDGTAQLVTITIHGTDDAAVISGDFAGTVLEAGGVANGIPGIPTATGDLDAADVDNPPGWTPTLPVGTPTPGDNGFGSFTLTASGVWTYTLDNGNPAVQALNAGQTLTDTFTATTVGGTTQVVTITIDGANDAAVITGTTAGAVTEAGGVANGVPGTPTATGDLNSTDVDNPPDAWDVVTTSLRGASGYGSYTLTADGVWTYTLDNSNPAVQALNVGDTLTDTFTAFTVDGTAQLVTVTIQGANDAAVISGTTAGAVTEAGGVNNGTPGIPVATGDLTSTDVDNPNDAWTTVEVLRPPAPTASVQLHADGVRRLDLHARQQQRRPCTGAQCRLTPRTIASTVTTTSTAPPSSVIVTIERRQRRHRYYRRYHQTTHEAGGARQRHAQG